MQRRQFLARTVKLALGASAARLLSGSAFADDSAAGRFEHIADGEARLLVVMARALLPHRDLDDSHYLAVVEKLDAQPPETRQLIDAGIAQMNESARGDWLNAPVDAKLAVLEKLQREAFFAVVLNTGIDTLYRDPAVWELVGYEGSSIERGGYLNRGFDDIGWLP